MRKQLIKRMKNLKTVESYANTCVCKCMRAGCDCARGCYCTCVEDHVYTTGMYATQIETGGGGQFASTSAVTSANVHYGGIA